MARKRISDTTSGAVALFQDARQGAPAPPAGLRADAWLYWHGIISSRAPGEWDGVRLIVAEQAACAMAQVAELQAAIDRDGTMIPSQAGLRPHPACGLLDGATKRQLSLLRNLGLGVDNSRDGRRRDGAFQRAKRVVDDLEGEPLLAR